MDETELLKTVSRCSGRGLKVMESKLKDSVVIEITVSAAPHSWRGDRIHWLYNDGAVYVPDNIWYLIADGLEKVMTELKLSVSFVYLTAGQISYNKQRPSRDWENLLNYLKEHHIKLMPLESKKIKI